MRGRVAENKELRENEFLHYSTKAIPGLSTELVATAGIVTPENLRLRKKELDPTKRKRQNKS